MGAHLRTVAGNEKIFSRREQPFAVLPRSRNQRDPTGERFENPDRWDTGQYLGVVSARYMDRHACRRKGVGDTEIWEVPREFHAGRGEPVARLLRVAHAVHASREPQ